MINTNFAVFTQPNSKHKNPFKPITDAHYPKIVGINTHASTQQIFVKTLTGKEIPLVVNIHDTIATIKKYIHNKENVPHSEQSLISEGKRLDDDAILGDCNIQDGFTIYMVIRKRGGTYYMNNGSFGSGGNNQGTSTSP